MTTIQREIVAAMLFSKDDKLLLVWKNPEKASVYPDTWHIPGGGVEEGETRTEALYRELKEELGLDLIKYEAELVDDEGRGKAEKFLKTGEKVNIDMTFYVYKINIEDEFSGDIDIELDDELSDYKWVEIKELKALKLTPPSVTLFKKLDFLE